MVGSTLLLLLQETEEIIATNSASPLDVPRPNLLLMLGGSYQSKPISSGPNEPWYPAGKTRVGGCDVGDAGGMPAADSETEAEGTTGFGIVVVHPDGLTDGILLYMLLVGSSRLVRWFWVSSFLLLRIKPSQSSSSVRGSWCTRRQSRLRPSEAFLSS